MENFSPQNIKELQKALGEMTNKTKVISGGTDLIMHLNNAIDIDGLLYLGKVEEMCKIEKTDDNVYIGGAVTMTQLVDSPLLCKKFQGIKDAAIDVGSEQIRNNGTIGGNIANASPAGDLIPIVFMHNATIIIMGPKGQREVNVNDFILGPNKTSLNYNEVLYKIKLPIPSDENYSTHFVKLGSRKKVTISRICVALALTLKNDTVEDIGLYIGSISIKPIRLLDGEKIIKGKKITEDLKHQVSEILSKKIFGITPEEFDRDYKVWAAKGAIFDVFELFKA
ncbi:MAG: FAD binding domain-containing protein [Lachnospirales bacterium]